MPEPSRWDGNTYRTHGTITEYKITPSKFDCMEGIKIYDWVKVLINEGDVSYVAWKNVQTNLIFR